MSCKIVDVKKELTSRQFGFFIEKKVTILRFYNSKGQIFSVYLEDFFNDNTPINQEIKKAYRQFFPEDFI